MGRRCREKAAAARKQKAERSGKLGCRRGERCCSEHSYVACAFPAPRGPIATSSWRERITLKLERGRGLLIAFSHTLFFKTGPFKRWKVIKRWHHPQILVFSEDSKVLKLTAEPFTFQGESLGPFNFVFIFPNAEPKYLFGEAVRPRDFQGRKDQAMPKDRTTHDLGEIWNISLFLSKRGKDPVIRLPQNWKARSRPQGTLWGRGLATLTQGYWALYYCE